MAGWNLQLIGGWRLERERVEYTVPKRQQRLIALLAVEGTSERSRAARVLWPDSGDGLASNCLRGTICRVSRDLPGLLVAKGGRIRLVEDVDIDLHALRLQLGSSMEVEGSAAARVQLLGSSELLPGWYDDWILEAQDQWRVIRVSALRQLASRLLERGDTHDAVEAACSAMHIDPLDEEAQQLVLQAWLAEGNRAQALRGYADFSSRYFRELGVMPSFPPGSFPDAFARGA